MMNKLFFVLVAIVAAAAGLLLSNKFSADNTAAPQTDATVFQTSRPLPDFQLIDHNQQPFSKENLQQQWSLLFFGFTHCPDICPTTLFLLTQVRKELADLPPEQQPELVLVSVDPARDTPQQLAQYVPHFGPNITGVTGDIASIQALTAKMGVAYSYTPSGQGGYTVDHTASIFLVSPTGELKALFTTPHTKQAIARDYRAIMAIQ